MFCGRIQCPSSRAPCHTRTGSAENRLIRTTLTGRLEAILDMFRAHMHGTATVADYRMRLAATGQAPSDYWLRIRSWNAYTHKFLQRPHQIQLSVPFAFLSVHWDPTSGNAAFIPKNGSGVSGDVKSLEPTPVTYFFELWRDFDGRRLPVRHSGNGWM